jgi:hypothetical protein
MSYLIAKVYILKKNEKFICGVDTYINYVMTTAYNYADLQGYWRKGLRNGNWRKLNPPEERSLYGGEVVCAR